MATFNHLIEALIDEPETRSAFARDPAGVARRFRAELDPATREALLSFDWSADGIEMLRRMNKGCQIY